MYKLYNWFQRKVAEAGARVHQARKETADENYHRSKKLTCCWTYMKGFYGLVHSGQSPNNKSEHQSGGLGLKNPQ